MSNYWKPLIVGILGASLFLSGWHLYTDHQNYHRLMDAIATQQQQNKNQVK